MFTPKTSTSSKMHPSVQWNLEAIYDKIHAIYNRLEKIESLSSQILKMTEQNELPRGVTIRDNSPIDHIAESEEMIEKNKKFNAMILLLEEIKLYQDGAKPNKIEMIKKIRELTGANLTEAKRCVDWFVS